MQLHRLHRLKAGPAPSRPILSLTLSRNLAESIKCAKDIIQWHEGKFEFMHLETSATKENEGFNANFQALKQIYDGDIATAIKKVA